MMRVALLLSILAAALALPARAADVCLTEVHYHPAGSDRAEFVELHNPTAAPVDLRGWSFVDGIRWDFEGAAVIPPGGYLVVARSREELLAEYPVPASLVRGDFSGALDNAGERLVLVDGSGRVREEFSYGDSYPFDPAADGEGLSLQRVCLELPAGAPFNWRAAAPSPGASGAEAPQCPPALAPPDVERFAVIFSEIHYHPPGDPDPRLEFVEIHNRSAAERDISGWKLDGGLLFTLPSRTRIPARGYLLIAQDPALLASSLGLDAARVLGPFEAGTHLSNSGEALRLLDAAGNVQDELEYSDSGEWPALADGLGASLQRVNPLGPSGAPGNWRAAAPPPETEPQAEWKEIRVEGRHDGPRLYIYLLGAGEMLVDDVRLDLKEQAESSFIPDGGFDGGMGSWSGTGNHSGSSVAGEGGYGDGGPCLLVKATGAGNGFQNGVRYTFGALPDPASPCVLTVRVKARSGESQFIVRSSLAQGGDGLLYFKGNARTGESADPAPTPLAASNVGDPVTPPTIRLLGFDPPWPTSRDPVTITARVFSEDPVEVSATYQVGAGEAAAAPLADDGAGPDVRAGDGTWTGRLPPAPDGSLVWFSLAAKTSLGAVTFWPRWKNPAPVTGYQVVDDLPEHNEHLRLYYIFTPGALLDLSCADGAYRKGDFVDFRGRAYQGVGVKFRGETACGYPKKPIRVEFNKGDFFDGQSDLNLSAGWNDKSMLREKFAYDFFRDAGVAYCETHMARVHTTGGAFHGAYFTVEDPSEEYLERNDLNPDGALYKCRTAMLTGSTSGFEPRTEASSASLPAVGSFAGQLNSLNGTALVDFLVARVDVEEIFDYQAVQVIIIDGDSVMKNWLLYLGRSDLAAAGPDLVHMFAWDCDLTYGQMLLTTDERRYDIHPLFQTQTYPFHDQGYHGLLNALLQRAPGDYFVKAFYGRMWRLLDKKFRAEVLFPTLDEYEAATGDTVREDLRKWPRTWGSRGTDPDYWRRDFRTFVTKRREFLEPYLLADHPTTMGRKFKYVPPPQVKFTEIHYNPPGQGSRLEFVELTSLEDAAVPMAGWDIPLVGYVFPAGAEIPARGTILVAKEPDFLRRSPGFQELTIFGPYPGGLPGKGGILRLRDDGQGGSYHPETIDVVVYRSRDPWPEAADGGGKSLELVALNLEGDEAGSWRAGWSPGSAALENRLPVASIRLDPLTGPAPLTVLLSALGSADPDGDELEYAWSIDGVDAGGRAVFLQTFDAPGTRRIALVVSDPYGGTGRMETEVVVTEASEPLFRRGDSNGDSRADLSDAVALLGFLFLGAQAPGCPDAADADDSGALNITDAVYLLAHLFLGGPPPPEPGPTVCGPDPTEDALAGCDPTGDCP